MYFSVDTLHALVIFQSLDHLHDTTFKLARSSPPLSSVLLYAVGLVLLWELLFPLSVFWRRPRWLFLAVGVVFHLSTLFVMNIFFPHQLVLYLMFVDWDALARRFTVPSRTVQPTP